MATCPNPDCRSAYEPSPDHAFCERCGTPVAQDDKDTQKSGRALPAPGSGRPAVANARVGRTIGVGEGTNVGRDVIIQQTNQESFCAIGGEQIHGERTFRCPECNRSPLCDRDFDEARRLCAVCKARQSIACPLCGELVSPNQTFTCARCRRMVGNYHLVPGRNWCTECAERWAGVVSALTESMEKDEVVIAAGGNVVDKGEIELQGGVLRTRDGRPVATIKENTWYHAAKSLRLR